MRLRQEYFLVSATVQD
ncbi:hypothetical protein JTM49_36790, partial [Pseudomonas aeruginosa]|nr:hypothetical protein [Pseudomonas aeruginosa]